MSDWCSSTYTNQTFMMGHLCRAVTESPRTSRGSQPEPWRAGWAGWMCRRYHPWVIYGTSTAASRRRPAPDISPVTRVAATPQPGSWMSDWYRYSDTNQTSTNDLRGPEVTENTAASAAPQGAQRGRVRACWPRSLSRWQHPRLPEETSWAGGRVRAAAGAAAVGSHVRGGRARRAVMVAAVAVAVRVTAWERRTARAMSAGSGTRPSPSSGRSSATPS